LPLGLNLVKVTGDDNTTVVEARGEENVVIIKGTFKTANPDFKGTFGLPNLPKLNTILNIPEYKEDAIIQITTKDDNGTPVPDSLHFENSSGDFVNDYRFMVEKAINMSLKSSNFRGANWNVTFEPTIANIQRFKFQTNANSDEKLFVAKTEGSDLKFYFGDHSTHAGNFVFHPNVNGTLTKNWYWPVIMFLGILSLSGDKTVMFSDDGAAQIVVDSGLIVYNYIFPAQSK
jgi:hypothetical protein